MKEVIILGSGQSSSQCPFDAELWTTAAMLPNLEDLDPASTKVFAFGSNSSEGRETARSLGIQIISDENFPRAEIVKEFGLDYFLSPASFMIAYAVYLHYEKFRIYGVDLESSEEYAAGKPRIAYWLGVATGRGIEWDIATHSKLYRVMKENVKDRYDRAMALRDAVTARDYVSAIEKGCDPFIFISGADKEAVTVKNYDQNGKEVSSWHFTT